MRDPIEGIAIGVRQLIDRIASERPGALDDGTLHARAIGNVNIGICASFES